MNDTDPLVNLPKAQAFLNAVAPTLPAYRYGVFSYVAAQHGCEMVILRGRLELRTERAVALKDSRRTLSLRAGQVKLDIAPSHVEAFVRCAVTNSWLPPIGDQLLRLLPASPPTASQSYAAYHEKHAASGGPMGRYVHRLILKGIDRFQILNSQMETLERELRDIGIDSVDELMRLYQLHGSDETTLDVVALPVAQFQQQSSLKERHVDLTIQLAKGLQHAPLNVTIRNADPNASDIPLALNGSQMTWTEHNDYREALWSFDLPEIQAVDCRAVYSGYVQDEVRLADPDCVPNRLGMMVELVDPGFNLLSQRLIHPRKNQGQDFEVGVGWLLQLLGFTAIPTGAMSGLKVEPDHLVMAPRGDVLIVECTIGVPNDDKLTRLTSRTVRMRQLLEARSEPVTTAIVPVLVTPLAPAELGGIREKAKKQSVLILCRPELEEALARSRFTPDPDATLQSWRNLGLMRLMTGEEPMG